MSNIPGTYKRESQENMEAFLQAMGMPGDRIQKALSGSLELDIQFDGSKYTENAKDDPHHQPISCNIGDGFEKNLPGLGGKIKMMMKMDGENTLVSSAVNGEDIKVVRKFSAAGLEIASTRAGVTGKGIFKRV